MSTTPKSVTYTYRLHCFENANGVPFFRATWKGMLFWKPVKRLVNVGFDAYWMPVQWADRESAIAAIREHANRRRASTHRLVITEDITA